MNALLDHQWGVSHAQDRVWAQVTGLAPQKAVRRLILVLQAFVDESFSKDEFVLGGHIATAEQWAVFTKEWEELLPNFGTRSSNGAYHFKMKEMAQTPERMARVPIFYKVIEDNVLTSISARICLDDFRRAHERAQGVAKALNLNSIDFKHWANPYFFTFRLLMDEFHIHRNGWKSIPAGEKVDFIFDKRSEKKPILEAWDEYIDRAPNDDVRESFGSSPHFEDDQEFLGLQAADLWAWWVREWYEEENSPIPQKMRDLDFGLWRGKPRLKIVFSMDEDQILEALRTIALQHLIDHPPLRF